MINIKKKTSLLLAASLMFSSLYAGSFAVNAEGNAAGLEPGEYTVPIVSLTSAAPLAPVKEAFNKAFGDEVTVTVADDGSAVITAQNHHMSIDFSSMGMGTFDANVAWIEGAEVISTYETVYTNTHANLADASAHTQDAITVPSEFSVPYALDENGSQTLTIGVDFMAAMFGQDVDTYSTDVTLTLDMSRAESVKDAFKFGSAETELEPGVYSIPVSMKNASNIENDSMAASCIGESQLEVTEDGAAVITINMLPVTIGPITAYASDWGVYQSYGIDGADQEPAEFDTDQDGNVSKITFTVPDTSWDGVYVSMYIASVGMSQNAYLKLDYANAKPVGAETVYYGTAKVQQFGKYDVNAAVTVVDGVISSVDITGANFGGTYADFNKTKLQSAIDGLKDWWNGKTASQTNVEDIYGIDAVSGATISSEAIRNAVMDALELTYEEETITVPESVEPGVYDVKVQYYTDIVLHYLTGGEEKRDAKLVVDNDGNMTIDFDVVNGTDTEPLYILGYNGYYEDNSLENELSSEGTSVNTGTTEFSDEYFAEGTPVVTHISMPLDGALAAEYNTNVRLYVPAMNNLNGELSGIVFENGIFNVDTFLRVWWDDMVRTGDYVPEADITKDGVYAVDFDLYKTDSDSVSMGNTAFADSSRAVITTKDGVSKIRIRSNPVTIEPYYSALEGMQFENANGQWQAVTPVKTEAITATDGENEYPLEYLKEFEFVLPDVSAEYIPVKILVPHTPMEMIGDEFGYVDARIKLDMSSLEVYDDTVAVTEAKADADVLNVIVENSGVTRDAVIIAAFYDETGAVIGTEIADTVLGEGVNNEALDAAGYQEADAVKVFVWSDMESAVPLADAFRVSVSGN